MMISNNTTVYKFKSSKSYRDLPDAEGTNSDESGGQEGGDKYGGYERDRGYRGSGSSRNRARSSEYRSNRSSQSNRSSYRGRRGEPSRRNDKDSSDNYYNSRKYEGKGDGSAGYRGKFYEPEKKSDIKLNLPEDTRISKLLRRLNTETNQEISLQVSKKLLEVLLLPDNAAYVRKAFHILGESMYEILHVSPGLLAKQQAAKALGRMGYIMGQEGDFDRYHNWLFSKMNSSFEEMQVLLMYTFKETLSMELKKPILGVHMEDLINNLVAAIEVNENSEVFKAILEVLVMVVEMYPNGFYAQFRDTIDLLFGWHVDHTQSLSTIEFISKEMQKLSHHFKYNVEFSVSLVENFLEDITNFGAELSQPDNIDHVTVLILALNTVLKCLDENFHPMNNKSVTTDFVVTCMSSIIKTVTDVLDAFLPENLVIAANDCITQLLSYLDTKSQSLSNSIYNLLDLELTLINDFHDNALVSLLLFISKVIKELSANLPLELIDKLIGPQSDIVKLRSSPYAKIQNSVICVYQALLNLKNVSLLQEAYRYVLGDLERYYMLLVPKYQPFMQSNPFESLERENSEEPSLIVMFLLRCLSQLANASSIIVMWALKPSILELVGVNLRPYDPDLAMNTPYIQYSLLYLLFSHCKCYNHFVSNSTLVANKQDVNRFALTEGLGLNDVTSTSPNSGNLAIILDILHECLKIETSVEVTLLLLQWLQDILINSESYLEGFYLHEKFAGVTDVLVKCGYHFNARIIEAVCDNLEKLLSNKQLAWSNAFLTSVSDLCKLHMTSNNAQLRDRYSRLSANIPWDIAIVEFNKVSVGTLMNGQKRSNSNKDFNGFMIHMAQHLHLNGSVDAEMYSAQFKKFMEFLLNKSTIEAEFLEQIFTTCWTHDCESQMNMELFYDLAINSRQVLTNWCTMEAAQFCVNYKLRTPLGKPIETFTKIENALNQLGNDLVMMKKTGERLNEKNVFRVRLLLQFVEHLEKSIYNASEGCAVAMPQSTKPVRSFFIANTNTCNEWLSRIRMVVMHVALHCGESGVALKHGQSMLKDLVSTHKTSNVDFERVAMFVTLAWLNLKEPEALYGLYTWCKQQTGKRYLWIKYAADQAAKRYETAVEGYKKVLHDAQLDKEDKKLDQDVCNFLQDQVVVCYKELNNWSDLFEWHTFYQASPDNGKKYWFNTTDWECNKSLFDLELDEHALQQLTTWQTKEEEATWSIYENLTATETNLYNYALNLPLGTDGVISAKLNNSLEVIQKNIQDLLPLAPSEFLQNYSLLQYVAIGLRNLAENYPAHTVFLVSECFEKEIEKVDTSVLRKILWWSEYFCKVQNQGFNLFSSNLRLDIIKRARKEKNLWLASRQLIKFFKDKGVQFANPYLNQLSLSDFEEKLPENLLCTLDVARCMTEVIKVYHCNEESRVLALNLCASVSTPIFKYAEQYNSLEHRKICGKILLKLSSWLQSSDTVNITDINSPLGKLIMVLPEIKNLEPSTANLIPLNEMAVGRLMRFGADRCPGIAKSWNAFGTWCYKWGKKIVDQSSSIKNNLSEEHCLEIKALLPFETSEEDLTKIFIILSQTRSVIIGEEDIDSSEINTTEMIQAQLQTVGILRNATEEQLKNLIQIWRNTQKSIYNLYSLSAEAYFKYLHLVMDPENLTKSTECSTITITLRLLRLIVKYALELQSILEEGLKTTPTKPWKMIIPQLFSRLNHPESYVRHRVSELLCRVAEDAPQLITFPAVVGALEGGLKFDFSEIKLPKDCLSQNNEENEENDLDNDEDNYESDNEEVSATNTLQTCFKTMVDTLSKQDPETISQVQTLVKELRRITLLWDELWLGTLAQHHSEISKRQHQLEYEVEKVNENSNLTKEEKLQLIMEKHRIIIKPIVFVLEQLNDVTSVEPETPHEKQFQEKYLEDINAVIEKLKSPEHPEKPQDSLSPLKQLQKKFQQKFHKRASYSLKMQDISPVLHAIKNTLIAMPGLANKAKKNITISHVSNVVSILPTKTKPKKLVFYGSDGQTYTYLFKGLEDLHLDERIMQFLSIANTMMAQNADPAGNNLYRARHYSVIPLGPRSGLISWVDGTTPVFALYKRWQQRELAKPNAKGSTTVPRPSELFYNKLMEHGVKNIDNRKEWPLSTLKQVLVELMLETPCDLIAKELWCNAVSTNTWWQVVKRYSYSVAVMSIIGYIIGLGDRHLDNVLIDLLTGDVVHIDYNVCFEKGKTLRVPEKVPFRLTTNIKEALGVTGVEGIFRLACENVLKTMRKGRETLLTLLEAFVYDPLIDWTVGGEVLAGTTFGGVAKVKEPGKRQTKKELEREVTLSMFNVRCTEMKVEWLENRDDILNEIPGLLEQLNNSLELKEKIDEIEDQLQDLHQQLALVKEAEAQGPKKHTLYKLPSLYDAYVKSQESMNIARKGLCDIVKDCEVHVKTFKQLLTSFENQQFVQWLNELKFNVTEDNVNIFDLVKEFLHNAGKDDVVSQCEKSEVEVTQLAQNLNLHARKCIQTFQDYFSLLVQCPKSYIENHRMKLYNKWANYLLETKSTEGCDLVIEEFKTFLESKTQNSAQIVNVAYALDNYYKETVMQVNKLFEELTAIRTKDPTHSLEGAYSQAKKNVDTFLGEKNADKALKFVLAGELLFLNRQFLTSEIAAQKSGTWLIKLTSREGDWFLDDLVLHSIRAVEMVNNIPLKAEEDPRLCQIIEGMRRASLAYKGLYDLNFNFHTIILPETMKKIQADEDSVLSMIADLNRIIADSDVPVQDLLRDLEKLLTCVLMHVDVHTTYDVVLEKVALIQNKFLSLIPDSTPSQCLSQGKMLLMGFNGLFEKFSQEISHLVAALSSLDLPRPWKKLDHVKEAKTIAPHIFNPEVKSVLENIFFLKKLVAVSDFFMLAQQMCQGIRCNVPNLVYSDEILTKPIKQFTAEFISRQLLGVTPEIITYAICLFLQQLDLDVTHEIEQKDIGAESKVPLDELYQKAYTLLLKEGVFSNTLVSQASSLETNLKFAWEKVQEPKKIEQKLTILQSSAFRLQSQLAVHSLMFDDVLSINNFPSARAKFVLDMRGELANLQITFKELKEAKEQQQTLIEKAYQRLNWAKGANPNVVEILAAFESAVRARDFQLNLEQKIASSILQSYTTILQHELLRTSNAETTKDFDNMFLSCFDKWRQACQYNETKTDTLLPAEESILSMLSLDLIENPRWLHQVAMQITEVISIYQKKLADKKEMLFLFTDNLEVLINNFKAIYNIHTRLMQDVRGLLKTMAKIDDYSQNTQFFVHDYRKYVERFNMLFNSFKEWSMDKALMEEMAGHLEYIRKNTEDIYEGLLSLQDSKTNRPRLRRQSCVLSSDKSRGESKVQQRNAYALNVWRRVKMKLEGRDPDPGRKCTAQEQVDYVIREATSLDNLALLYEGWTPWV